jgi:uncharacterized protein YlxW (UPF0749 family)
MTVESLQTNWALLLAATVGLVIVLFALSRLIGSSGRAKLHRVRRRLKAERKKQSSAEAAVARAEHRARKLGQRAETVKPRLVAEANEALEDAKALARIAHDRMLIAENHVRRVILEEFPPAKQQRLRARYLPESAPDKRPFSF